MPNRFLEQNQSRIYPKTLPKSLKNDLLTLTQGHPKNFSKNFPQRAKR